MHVNFGLARRLTGKSAWDQVWWLEPDPHIPRGRQEDSCTCPGPALNKGNLKYIYFKNKNCNASLHHQSSCGHCHRHPMTARSHQDQCQVHTFFSTHRFHSRFLLWFVGWRQQVQYSAHDSDAAPSGILMSSDMCVEFVHGCVHVC